jgi:hypothetical protein
MFVCVVKTLGEYIVLWLGPLLMLSVLRSNLEAKVFSSFTHKLCFACYNYMWCVYTYMEPPTEVIPWPLIFAVVGNLVLGYTITDIAYIEYINENRGVNLRRNLVEWCALNAEIDNLKKDVSDNKKRTIKNKIIEISNHIDEINKHIPEGEYLKLMDNISKIYESI